MESRFPGTLISASQIILFTTAAGNKNWSPLERLLNFLVPHLALWGQAYPHTVRYRRASTMMVMGTTTSALHCSGTCQSLWSQQTIQKLKHNCSPARGTNFPWTWEHYKLSFSAIQIVLVSHFLNKSLHNQHNSSNFFFWFKEEKKIPSRTLLLLKVKQL